MQYKMTYSLEFMNGLHSISAEYIAISPVLEIDFASFYLIWNI